MFSTNSLLLQLAAVGLLGLLQSAPQVEAGLIAKMVKKVFGGRDSAGSSTTDLVNLSTAQIARLRQFQAEDHYITTPDGYIINVVYIRPQPNGTAAPCKRPVIFNHGTTQSSTYFVTNSVGIRPRDLSSYDADSLSQQELDALLGQDPLSASLPFLLSCFGHPVYLINRRGTEFSLGRAKNDAPAELRRGRSVNSNSTTNNGLLGQGVPSDLLSLLTKPQINLESLANTLSGSYWNFSLDEQARYDLPAVIEFVQNQTKSLKVAYVGHSIGNVLMLMLQSEKPEYADLVEPFLAWSPDFYLSNATSILKPLLVSLEPVLARLNAPFPPTPIDPLTRTLLALACQTQIAQNTICRLIESLQFGFSGNEQKTKPAFMASQFYSVSAHEAAQLAQNAIMGKMYHFRFPSPQRNQAAYNGSVVPPVYDVGNIVSESISFWRGENDALATPADVARLKQDLKVPVLDNFIKQVPFNHYDLLFGHNVSTLVNLPSLKLIESYK